MIIRFKGKAWEWNPEDKKLMKVNDWISDLDIALQYVEDNIDELYAIQAGGAMGIWPVEMAKYFGRVYTFEPDKNNFLCLEKNVKDHREDGVIIYANAALGDHNGYCHIELPPSEQCNAGAYYIMPNAEGIKKGDVPLFTIDTLVDDIYVTGRQCGLIQLDVEGRELEVLKGGKQLIMRDRPVIMAEEKPLPQDKRTGHVVGELEKWLIDLGYVVARRVHRDIIFVPGE